MPEDLYDPEVEDALVASVILQPDYLDDLDIDVEDFAQKQSQLAWRAILSLKGRNAAIDEFSVRREAKELGLEEWYIPKVISETPTSLDCLRYAQEVKSYSQKRKLMQAIDHVRRQIGKDSFRELIDYLRASLEALNYEGMSSRFVTFSYPRIIKTDPPIYRVTVSTVNRDTSSDIDFSSAELDSIKLFRRKIREKLYLNPIIHNFDGLIDHLVRTARHISAPDDASREETICEAIRNWFKNADEAELVDDLSQGYIEKDGYYWFHGTSLLNFLNEKEKLRVNKPELISLLVKHGLWESDRGHRNRAFRLKDGVKKLWGLPKSFFKEETEEQQTLELETEKAPEPEEATYPEETVPEEGDFDWLDL